MVYPRSMSALASIEWHPEAHLVTVRPVGTITVQTCTQWFAEVDAHPAGAHCHRFLDLSRANPEFGFEEIVRMAQMRQAHHPKGTRLRLVFFSDTDVGYGMARMYETLMANHDSPILVTRDRAAAAAFLDVPVALLHWPE